MKHRYFKTVAIILVLVILAGSYYYFANWPPFPDYQEEFDYTVSGVKYRTEAYCKESAFQDPWAAWRLSVKGELEGTLFDSQEMTAGMPAWVASQIHNNERFKEVFTNLSNNFKSRVLFKSNSGGRISYLYVIMDADSGSYYVVWKG